MKKKYQVIIGLGHTGFSVAQYLARQNLPFVVMDSRDNPPKLVSFKSMFPDVLLYLGGFDTDVMLAAERVILSPGLSPFNEAFTALRNSEIPIVGDVEIFAQIARAPIIAITGTNGKGTVSTLVATMLKEAGYRVCLGGNIGIPVLDLIMEPIPDFYVLELSSAQLQITQSLISQVSAILNIRPDHEDYHQSFDEYIAAKHRIYTQSKHYVFNRADPLTKPNTDSLSSVSFGLDKPNAKQLGMIEINGRPFFCCGEELIISCDEVKLTGWHNYLNIMAACAIVQPFLTSWQSVSSVLRHFNGLDYRCQLIQTNDEVAWYNDSKGANTAATIAAIQSVAQKTRGRLILIVGGIAKQQDLSDLKLAIDDHVTLTIVYGQDAMRLARLCQSLCKVYHAKDFQSVVNYAKRYATAQDSVLFSPACASFDMFTNAEERGARFTELVQE